jgi:hypothetical protein
MHSCPETGCYPLIYDTEYKSTPILRIMRSAACPTSIYLQIQRTIYSEKNLEVPLILIEQPREILGIYLESNHLHDAVQEGITLRSSREPNGLTKFQ